MDIFKLVGSIFVDTDAANQSIQKTDKKVEGLGEKFKSGVKTVAKWGAALGGAALAAGAAITKAAKDEAENLDVIDKASIRMGISAESYQELAYAANLCGVEMSTMEKAAKKLEGTDLNMEDALNQLMAISDETERTQAAIDLFGESVAYQMTPLLQQGADGMAAMKQEANDLGLVMSQDTVSAGAEMNDMFSKVEQSMGTLKTGLVADLMPYVMEALQWVIDHMPEIRETVSKVIGDVKQIIEGLKPVLETIFKFVGQLWETTLKPTLDAILQFLDHVFKGDWSSIWGDVRNIFGAVFEGLKTLFKEPINWIIGKLNNFIDGVNRIKIPDWVPGIGGKGLSIRHIPKLAEGGVLERGQVGLLEGSGAEAVVPLQDNKKWLSALAADMKTQGIGGSAQTDQLLTKILTALDKLTGMGVYLDGRTLVGELAPAMDTELGQLATRNGRHV